MKPNPARPQTNVDSGRTNYWRRLGLAGIAVVLVGWGWIGSHTAAEPGLYLAMIRAGILCAVVWLAWPQLELWDFRLRLSAPVKVGLLVLLLIAALRPRWLVISSILAVILLILHSLARSRWSRWFKNS